MNDLKERIDSYIHKAKPFNRAIEDVVISSIPQTILIVVGFITSVLIARGLGPSGLGQFALIISVPTLIVGLSDLGIGQTAIRFGSKAVFLKNKSGLFAVLRWAFRVRIFLVLIIGLIFFVLTPFITKNIWHDESLIYLTRLSLLIAIFTVISHIPYLYFQSIKKFRINTILSTLQTLVLFVGILLIAFFKHWSLELVVIVSIIASAINATIFLFSVPKIAFIEDFKPFMSRFKNFWIAPKINNELKSSEIHSFAFYMVISSIAVMIALQADIWLIGFFLNTSQVGIYNVAKYFTIPLTIILGAINTALWPRVAAFVSEKEIANAVHTTFKFSALVAFVALFYSLIAPLTTSFIFGQEYGAAIIIGQVLCFRYCISILICPIGIIGYNLGMVRVYWWINLLQLVVVVVISVLLLPIIGPMGSAIALIANEVIGSSITGLIISRKIKNTNDS